MADKKTICLMTNWYPTPENPYQGLFFKEQSFAVEERYNFLVIHYKEHFKKKPGRRFSVVKINEERNTTEYNVDAWLPINVMVKDSFYNFKVTHGHGNRLENIGKYISPRRKEYTANILNEIFNQFFKDSIDLLYCVDAQTEAYALYCVSQSQNIPYMIGEHAPVPWPGTLINDFNKEAIEHADSFLAISEDKIRQILMQNIHLPRTYYIGNMVDETAFRLSDRKNQVKTFITVAANSFYKNYDMLIGVMNRLKEITCVPFRIMIVGYGSNKGYSKNAEELEQKIKTSSFGGAAELIPEVPHAQLADVLNRADAFIMTSIQEGQPVSCMEAACCGLPVFSTRCGGVEDYVNDQTGRIYPITDVEGMANGLKDYLEGTVSFDSQVIRSSVIQRYGREAFIHNFSEAVEQTISMHSK